MPAPSTGRNFGSAAGRSAGHHKAKRDEQAQHVQVTRQAKRAQRAAAPANRRAQAEADRRFTLRKSNEARDLHIDARDVRAPSKVPSVKTGPTTGGALKSLFRAVAKRATTETDTKIGGKQNPIQMGLGNALPALKLASLIPGTPREIAKNTSKDVYQFPAQVVPSVAQTASAIDQAVRKHNTAPLKAMARDYDEHDPVWNTALAAADLVTGDTKNAKKRISAAGRSAVEHPGYTALEVFGAKGATGRLITRTASGTERLARGAAHVTETGAAKRVPRAVREASSKTATRVADRARKVASTERETQRLPGTNLVVHRQHTRDAFQRLADRKQDTQRRRKATELRDEADRIEKADPVEAAKKREAARRWDPDIITNRGIRRAVDEHVDSSEQVRRAGLRQLIHDVRKETKGAKRGGPLVNLLAQKITKADLPELKAYHQRLVEEGKKFGTDETSKIQANKTLVDDLGKAISDVERGKVDLGRMQRIADAYTERSRASQQELVDRDLLHPHEAERAALTPHAVAQMDAGREPETLKAFATAASKKAEQASGKVKAAKTRQSQLGGAQKSQRGRSLEAETKRDIRQTRARPDAPKRTRAESVVEYIKRVEAMDPEVVKAAIRKEDARVRKMDKAKGTVKTAKETSKKARARAAKANERAAENPLVLPGGKPLSTEAIRESAGGVPAFISQKPRGFGRSDFFTGADRAPGINSGLRSGRATAEGVFDASPDSLLAQEARTHQVVAAFDSFKRLVDRFGYREGGELKQADTFKDADQIALNLSKRDGREWVPMRVNPIGASKEQLAKMVRGEGDKTRGDKTLAQTLGSAGDQGEGGPWIVVPKSAASQMSRHMSKMDPGDLARLMQAGSTQFRRTVLSLSPTWFAGNTGEATLRSALSQVGPRSWATGRRALRAAPNLKAGDSPDLEGLTAKQIAARAAVGEARTIGSGRTALVNRAQMHRDATQFEEGFIRDVGEQLHKFGQAEAKGVPLPPKAAAAIWNGWTHLSMDMVNRTIENQFQTAMLGKAIRNQRSGAGQRVAAVRPKQLMTKRARDLSDQAAKEQAAGLVNENTAAALGREVDRMYGRYSKMSPEMRSLVANYTPFIAWTMNAAKFVARLPVDHPAFTAMSAAMERQTEEWRKDHGLDLFMGDGKVPLWLQGSIPDDKGGHYRAPTRYTPFSLGVDPGGTIAQQVLPQLNGPMMALRGLDWKGDPLKDKDGKPIEGPATFGVALGAFADSMIPGRSLLSKIGKKGSVGGYLKDALTQYTAPQKPRGGSSAAPSGFDDSFDTGGFDTGDFDSGFVTGEFK